MKNIHILPTNKPSRLAFDLDENFYLKSKEPQLFEFQNLVQNRELYITNEEEIKESGWYEHNGVIFRADDVFDDGNNPNNSNPKVTDFNHKIILTTDQDLIKDGVQAIDDEFLEWFVKNSSCEEVEVEKIKQYKGNYLDCFHTQGQCDCGLKPCKQIFFTYKIIIPKEEPKQEETLEEFTKESFKSRLEEHLSVDYNDGVKLGAKWQQERSYSEEDMRRAFCRGFGANIKTSINDAFYEWFEQFKKK